LTMWFCTATGRALYTGRSSEKAETVKRGNACPEWT
jgi:hypothetical protein